MKIWSKKGEDVIPEVEEYLCSSDISCDTELVFWDVVGSIAHTYALESAGVLNKKEAAKISSSLKKLISMNGKGEFSLDESLEDVHSNVESWLTNDLGELGKKIHAGRSRNDQAALDILLYSKFNMLLLHSKLSFLCKEISKKASEHDCPMPGYTHSKKAMITTFEHWVLAYCELLINDLQFLLSVVELIDKSPLGAAAGYGSLLNMPREKTAYKLGFSGTHVNTLSAIGSRSKTNYLVMSVLGSVMQNLASLSSDLIRASEKGLVVLPKSYCTGSSIMPHKNNPDVLEIIRARNAKVFGLSMGIRATGLSLPLGYHRDVQETKGSLMEAFDITLKSVSIITGLVSGIKPNKEVCLGECTPEMCLADFATIQAKKGQPFRDSYRNPEANQNLSNPKNNVSAKTHLGAPGDKDMKKNLLKKLNKSIKKSDKKKKTFSMAMKRLSGVTLEF